MSIINRPIITEKSLKEAKVGRFTFGVALAANKIDIKRQVEKMFGGNVVKVQTMRLLGKPYRTGKKWIMGERNDWKKAIVTLKKDQKIGLFDTKTE